MKDYKELYEAVLTGDAGTARTITEQALSEGEIKPLSLVSEYLTPAMDEIGRRFEASECFVPELLLAARAMKGAMELIQPRLLESGVELLGRVIVATVKGDLHDIGKNLVAAVMEGGGFEVIDMGVNVDPEKIVAMIKEKNAQIVALSALLTTTMPAMKTTIEAIEAAGVRDKVTVLVGGAPVTQRFADEIGADAYSDSAVGAVAAARKAVGA
jgi:methylmalonyl-CoA mutase cobalamin-binding domain/chain